MTKGTNKLYELVLRAIDCFNENESDLITCDVSERSICAKFASYLERSIAETEYNEYKVDVEYNRKDHDPKTLDDNNIVLDLIAHKHGCQDNLICIEMKKENNSQNYLSDRERLKKLTGFDYGYQYRLGLMIIIDTGKKNGRYGLRAEFYYENGEEHPLTDCQTKRDNAESTETRS